MVFLDKKGRKVFVVIPSFNHEKSVGCVISDLPPNIVDEVIVVDGYSTDNTVQRAKRAGATIIQDTEIGFGNAVNLTLKYLEPKARPEDIIVVLDAAYTYFPEELTELIKPVIYNNMELAISSRVAEKMRAGAIPKSEIFALWVINILTQIKFGSTYHRPGIFRAIEMRTLKKLELKESKNEWLLEMLIKAAARKIRIIEVPLNFKKIVKRDVFFEGVLEFFIIPFRILALFLRSI